MSRGFAIAAAFAAMAFATVFDARAQEANWDTIVSKWADERGEIVTPAARVAALKAFSDLFIARAFTLQMPPDATANIAKVISGAGYVAVLPDKVVVGSGENRQIFALSGQAQADAVAKALEPDLLFAQLVEFPLVTVHVDPAPPVDYTVEINGERVQAREKGVYRVDIGEIAVRVTRAPHPDCLWKGTLKARDKQQVDCQL
ncbi:hypothetical protein [Mesorhizobium sp. L48C026A00]|uniref:hypothetical protein n=1 Tax=Mesorhizobium sp. L48C026A00 TaxID=1287182 RepID=UPI0003CFE2A9|nr:hypothetical protein [Mesorhizobium sp. L48C026A00]ESZ21397.1 hypothetical protein X737_04495 [Mesorhizobium sp. L48C026A00]